MWGSHRVIYVFADSKLMWGPLPMDIARSVFADSTGELNLYYDLKLKEPLETETTGGAMFPQRSLEAPRREPTLIARHCRVIRGQKLQHDR